MLQSLVPQSPIGSNPNPNSTSSVAMKTKRVEREHLAGAESSGDREDEQQPFEATKCVRRGRG
ncbi:hypothetical protein CK203_113867 [Vitis vinifera]|uniref:Uncharacterized protein n=1 Tax=Vitis vinifera TaxID=29760 RepID=A0A438FG43_VITVI|nr:hypothetical protein CK203_113867 [Vitis vinifera]